MEKRDFSVVQNDGIDLVQKAGQLGASSDAVSHDLSAALFPKSEIYLSDRFLSNCRQYLRSVIGEIESQLCLKATEVLGIGHASIIEIGNSNQAYSHDHLRNADLLNSKDLLQHVFVKAQNIELTNRLLQKVTQDDLESNLAKHLDHEDKSVAEAAMALLVSHNRSNLSSGQVYARLDDIPAEILHGLIWSVTAAIRKISGYTDPRFLDAAELLLGDHDESQSSTNRAARLAGLLEHSDESDVVPHPIKDGLDLFLARIALRSGLSADKIVLFTAEPNMARFVIVMRALGISDADAISIFTSLNGNGNPLTPASFNEISRDQAVIMTENWSKDASFQAAELALNARELGADG